MTVDQGSTVTLNGVTVTMTKGQDSKCVLTNNGTIHLGENTTWTVSSEDATLHNAAGGQIQVGETAALHNEGTIQNEGAITVDEALRAMTQGGAYMTWEEKEKGTLAPGMLADLVLLDRSLVNIPHEEIRDITVRMTDTFSMACPAVFVAAAPKAMKNPANIPTINMDNAGSSVFFFPASP